MSAENNNVNNHLPNNKCMTLDVDCHHHLRNVWIKASCIDLCSFVKQELSEDLKDIDKGLRVKIEMGSFMRALDNCFN